jgi:hypothetical protein
MSSLICDLASQRQFLVAAGSAGLDRPFGTFRDRKRTLVASPASLKSPQ